MFTNFSFTTLHSSFEISLALVYRLGLTVTALVGELSLFCDSLNLGSVDLDARVRGTKELVVVAFVTTIR